MEESPFFPLVTPKCAAKFHNNSFPNIIILYRRVPSLQSIFRILRGAGKRESWKRNKAKRRLRARVFSFLSLFLSFSPFSSSSLLLELIDMLRFVRDDRVDRMQQVSSVHQLLTMLNIGRVLFLENLLVLKS